MYKIKAAVLALTCLFLLCEFSLANKTVEVQHKKLDFPEKELIFSHESYTDGSDVYAACKSVGKSDERLCKVVREKTPNSRDIQSCDLTLALYNRSEKSNKNKDELVVIPLGKDYAVFYLAEEEKIKNAIVKFYIINFNDCKIAETKIHVVYPVQNPKYGMIVVPYNDSFEVYYRDSMKSDDKGFVKILVNVEGKIIDGPVAAIDTNLYMSFIPIIVPVCTKSRAKGIFYMKHVDGSLGEYEFIIQKPDGVQKSLGKHKVYSYARKSTTNDFIGVCFPQDPVNSTVKCTQYDSNGNLKFEVEVMSNDNGGAIVHVFNLPKGGFLLLAGKCAQNYCNLDEVSFTVLKMDSNGKKVGSFNIDKLKFESGIKNVKLVPSFHINNDNKYVISIAQYKSTDSGQRYTGYISSSTWLLTDVDFIN